MSARFQRGERRQGFAFQKLQEGAAAGGDAGKLRAEAETLGAARVSPPPATENAEDAATARPRDSVPAANAGSSNMPRGPFQTTVPADSINF